MTEERGPTDGPPKAQEAEPNKDSNDGAESKGMSQTRPPHVTNAYLARLAKASEDTARVVESIRGPAQQLLESLNLHKAIIGNVGTYSALLDNIARTVDVSASFKQPIDLTSRLADAVRQTMPDISALGASIQRMQGIIEESASTATILEGIAAQPIREPTVPLHEPLLSLDVQATLGVEHGVRELARIGAGTAQSIGTLAELARQTLQQTLTLIAVMQQLHETTKTGVESNTRTAIALLDSVESLGATTEAGLTGTRAAVHDLVGVVQTLHETTQAGIDSNADATSVLLGWTKWLFVLTGVLVVFTAALLYLTWRLVPGQ